MARWLVNAALVVMVLADSVAATCSIDRVIVRPTGTITTQDPVALEIHINTSTSPAYLAEPTQVTVVENEILVDIFVDAWVNASPDSLVETVDLGTLPAGTYTYEVVQHPTVMCDTDTAGGSFCVEDIACNDDWCRCPVFTPPLHHHGRGHAGWAKQRCAGDQRSWAGVRRSGYARRAASRLPVG